MLHSAKVSGIQTSLSYGAHLGTVRSPEFEQCHLVMSGQASERR
jgi:hypothetical protein